MKIQTTTLKFTVTLAVALVLLACGDDVTKVIQSEDATVPVYSSNPQQCTQQQQVLLVWLS